MAKAGKKGIARLVHACLYSMAGLRAAWQYEQAFRQEIYLSVLVVPFALCFGQTRTQRAVLVFSWLVVPLVELINSAIEAIVDRLGEDFHELSGRAKDLGSAAVLLSILMAVIVWGLVFMDLFLS